MEHDGGHGKDGNVDAAARVLDVLIGQNVEQGQQIAALSAVCALLLRELCRLFPDPVEHLSKLEGEITGTVDAIAVRFDKSKINSAHSTQAISQLAIRVLNMASAGLHAADRPVPPRLHKET
ncbi:hypothetical protein [uncultured Agrobacterium sp.]|uniref:hypothetical protein n=1 Tax=uncultured Agrobacterium sp. TaxID=157277 RepID=UPI0025FE0BEE|nr:hypothetical protein [uncultured Agrobacterium sp.]